MKEDISIKIQNTRILPLRWLANYLFEPLSMKFFHMGLRRHDELDNMGAEERVFHNDLKLKTCWRLYEILNEPYMRWGTFYQLDMTKLKEDLENMDLSGDGWNDYDSDGVPYWEKYDLDWDYIDPETNDAFRLTYPRVIHNVYPEGKPVDQNMLDPNIGGHWRRDPK